MSPEGGDGRERTNADARPGRRFRHATHLAKAVPGRGGWIHRSVGGSGSGASGGGERRGGSRLYRGDVLPGALEGQRRVCAVGGQGGKHNGRRPPARRGPLRSPSTRPSR